MHFHNVVYTWSVPPLCFVVASSLPSVFLVLSLSHCFSVFLFALLNTHIFKHTLSRTQKHHHSHFLQISHWNLTQPAEKGIIKKYEDVFILQVFSGPWETSSKFLSPLDTVCWASLNSNDAYYFPLCPKLFGNIRSLHWMLKVLKQQQSKLNISTLYKWEQLDSEVNVCWVLV